MLSSQSLNPTQAAAYHSPKLPIMEQIVPFKDGNSEQTESKLSVWEQIVPSTYRWESGTKHP